MRALLVSYGWSKCSCARYRFRWRQLVVTSRGVLSQFWWPRRGGLIVNYVALSILLVMVTAVAVGAALSQALTRQIDRAADIRLAAGAAFFQARLSDSHGD